MGRTSAEENATYEHTYIDDYAFIQTNVKGLVQPVLTLGIYFPVPACGTVETL